MNKNNHIIDYLDYYLDLAKPPKYAVLLRGNWGSGKSWFIHEYIKSKAENSFLYVSLYGVTSYTEIEEILFEQIHPFLASKGMKIASKVLKGLIKTTIKVDFDGDKKDDGSISSGIPDINIPDYIKNIDKKTLIFDDLERCSIEIYNILGYINQFVENNELKVIIIANEEEIIKHDKHKDDAKAYLKIKEKLIGRSFDIVSDFDSALSFFIEQLPNSDAKILLEDKTPLIKDIFITANYNNLRHLRLAILDFERFYGFLPKIPSKKVDLVNKIISLFFSLSFEIKKGDLIEENIKEVFRPFFLSKEQQSEEEKRIDAIRNKYKPLFDRFATPIEYNLWIDFFKNGTTDKNHLKESIYNSYYFTEENSPDWMRLWRYVEMSDVDFEETFKRMYEKFEHFQIVDQYELIHVTGLFINFSSMKLIAYDVQTILEIAKHNVEILKKSNYLRKDKNEDFPSTGYKNLGYQGTKIQEMQQFLDYISEQVIISEQESYPEIATQLLEILRRSVDDFVETLIISNSKENLYFNTPILKFMDTNKFMKVFLEIHNKEKDKLSRLFEKRYRFEDYNKELKEEIVWLKDIVKLMNIEKDKRKGKISGNIIEFQIIKSIENAIKTLDDSSQ
ncbi:P-loop NTPase fold protein [Arcicella lustrica]|uniref:P-loop NTPase fold protein n=1 Tax=Arcicella lustrica TaxID=2984196 RepID=A0ABU5SJ44_9BACT|nr:P-loop NTPase fold protein [Arcicella sp. DC25W]MEA5427321.1 P-loop NTPase fold protein [Arcicella sp. DC25W]